MLASCIHPFSIPEFCILAFTHLNSAYLLLHICSVLSLQKLRGQFRTLRCCLAPTGSSLETSDSYSSSSSLSLYFFWNWIYSSFFCAICQLLFCYIVVILQFVHPGYHHPHCHLIGVLRKDLPFKMIGSTHRIFLTSYGQTFLGLFWWIIFPERPFLLYWLENPQKNLQIFPKTSARSNYFTAHG